MSHPKEPINANISENILEAIDIIKYSGMGSEKIIEFTFLDNAIKLFIPYAHTDLIQKTILRHMSFFENYLLKKIYPHIEKGSVIADIGANIGNHTVFFGLCCKAQVVHSFEPLKVSFKILENNVAINGLDNVVAHNTAVGLNGDRLLLERCTPTNLGGSQFTKSEAGEYPVVSLDSLEMERLDFIKLDVEGAQSPVLRGAEATLSACRPSVLVEVLDGEEAVFDVFKSMGYEVKEKIGKTDYFLRAGRARKWA